MKELYYGRIPLGVPIQKRPPSKYVSRPYPVLIDEFSYKPVARALDVELINIVTEVFEVSGYQSASKALDVVLRSVVLTKNIDGLAYKSAARSLDVMMISDKVKEFEAKEQESYQSNGRALDAIIKRIVITYNHPDDDSYRSAAKSLDVILNKGV